MRGEFIQYHKDRTQGYQLCEMIPMVFVVVLDNKLHKVG